jgi:hypothetical protein
VVTRLQLLDFQARLLDGHSPRVGVGSAHTGRRIDRHSSLTFWDLVDELDPILRDAHPQLEVKLHVDLNRDGAICVRNDHGDLGRAGEVYP